ncbi:tetratricopeptide repeat protein [Primorskyibacter sp. S187A]|uniref:tetratricopeptide repeat protein n=1 Tax=Primorskyibacter sp. S187A TaxID=3415130 RepID=UPI003C7B4DA8
MRHIAFALCLMPHALWAAGSGDSTPPTPTQTTKTCAAGLVWDAKTSTCVAPQDSRLDDDTRYDAVRELAYAGKIDAAQRVLSSMSDQQEVRVLTYWGFTYGRSGQYEKSLAAYGAALQKDPDSLLTRSYMGQAYVAMGAMARAQEQLHEIRARGGAGTWPATALSHAIRSGKGYSY